MYIPFQSDHISTVESSPPCLLQYSPSDLAPFLASFSSCSLFVFFCVFVLSSFVTPIPPSNLTYVNGQHTVKDKEREAELKKLRTLTTEAKEQVQSLKEENTRKAQLLAKMKETKLADNEIIDRSTKEAADNDATAKRSVRAPW